MAGNSPNEAVRDAIDPIRNAIQYITRGPLLVIPRGRYVSGSMIAVQSGDRPTKVQSAHLGTLWIFMMAKLRIVPVRDDPRSCELMTLEHVYTIAEDPDLMNEILTYHWTREAHPPQRSYPHLHIGSAILNEAYRAKTSSFPKLHIRTERIPIEAFVLMLIEEFGVAPLRSTWRRELTAVVDAHAHDQRR